MVDISIYIVNEVYKPFQETIDWRYRFHICLAYFLGDNRGYTAKISPKIWYQRSSIKMDPFWFPLNNHLSKKWVKYRGKIWYNHLCNHQKWWWYLCEIWCTWWLPISSLLSSSFTVPTKGWSNPILTFLCLHLQTARIWLGSQILTQTHGSESLQIHYSKWPVYVCGFHSVSLPAPLPSYEIIFHKALRLLVRWNREMWNHRITDWYHDISWHQCPIVIHL